MPAAIVLCGHCIAFDQHKPNCSVFCNIPNALKKNREIDCRAFSKDLRQMAICNDMVSAFNDNALSFDTSEKKKKRYILFYNRRRERPLASITDSEVNVQQSDTIITNDRRLIAHFVSTV